MNDYPKNYYLLSGFSENDKYQFMRSLSTLFQDFGIKTFPLNLFMCLVQWMSEIKILLSVIIIFKNTVQSSN